MDPVKELQNLIIDNPELEQLESLLAQFNIFEVLGAVHVELRHSAFLAYLLDPLGSHGLGPLFARRLLQAALSGADPAGLSVTPIQVDLWDLDDLEVRREWQNIDILLLSQGCRVAIVIENKVGAGEHSGQLQRYRKVVQQQFPDFQHLYLFLTPDGEPPSDQTYLPLSYSQVGEILAKILKARESTLGPDVRVLITHYIQMIRRHIVNESEIARLCQEIYRKHRPALDLIYLYIPDKQAAIREILDRLIAKTPLVVADQGSKSAISFTPRDWDTPMLRQGLGWTPTGQILLFQFSNRPTSLSLGLYIGPGPVEIRQRLLDIALHHRPPFKSAWRNLNQKWNNIYTRQFLTTQQEADLEGDDLEEKIHAEWAKFLENDLPEMERTLRGYPWIWEEAPSGIKE